jgi:hypothetical protein
MSGLVRVSFSPPRPVRAKVLQERREDEIATLACGSGVRPGWAKTQDWRHSSGTTRKSLGNFHILALCELSHIGHYANVVEETALASRQTAILRAGCSTRLPAERDLILPNIIPGYVRPGHHAYVQTGTLLARPKLIRPTRVQHAKKCRFPNKWSWTAYNGVDASLQATPACGMRAACRSGPSIENMGKALLETRPAHTIRPSFVFRFRLLPTGSAGLGEHSEWSPVR